MTSFDLGDSAEDDETVSSETKSAVEQDTARNQDEHDEETDPREEPAFPFSDDLRESWYVRDETLTAFKDAVDIDTVRKLREHRVRNETGRELQDAAIRVAANHPEEVAEIILDERGVGRESDD